MTILLSFHYTATLRGDGLLPELATLLERPIPKVAEPVDALADSEAQVEGQGGTGPKRVSAAVFGELLKMELMKTTKTDDFWRSFCEAKAILEEKYDVVVFGDSPAMADELVELVVHGPKRATAGLLRDYDGEPTAIPAVGGYAVVVNSGGDPLCVFQTTDVRIGPLSSVDDLFAWDEGEGDRTREWWLEAHTTVFTRQSEREKFHMEPDILTVFERFIVVWPDDVKSKI